MLKMSDTDFDAIYGGCGPAEFCPRDGERMVSLDLPAGGTLPPSGAVFGLYRFVTGLSFEYRVFMRINATV
jgi:hypothetical protein